VKPESVSLTDYNALKQERTEVIQTISGFLQVAGPMMMQFPASASGLLGLLQWLVAGVKGGSQIETQLNQMVTMAQQAASQPKPPPPPDPRLQAAQVKAGAEAQKAKMGVVQSIVDARAHQAQVTMDMQAATMQHQMDMQRMESQQRNEAIRSVTGAMTPGEQS
jgi:hypothetical protein